MGVSLVELASIKPYERNPRLNDAAVDAVARSLQEFGFRQPIVVDAEGVIVCGHTRWKAAAKLGLIRVPVQVARDLSPEQLRAYRIADNQTASIAEWDFEILPIELKNLQAAGSPPPPPPLRSNPALKHLTGPRAQDSMWKFAADRD